MVMATAVCLKRDFKTGVTLLFFKESNRLRLSGWLSEFSPCLSPLWFEPGLEPFMWTVFFRSCNVPGWVCFSLLGIFLPLLQQEFLHCLPFKKYMYTEQCMNTHKMEHSRLYQGSVNLIRVLFYGTAHCRILRLWCPWKHAILLFGPSVFKSNTFNFTHII